MFRICVCSVHPFLPAQAQRCRENSEVLEQRDAPIRAVSVHSPSVSEELLMGKGVCRVGYALNSKKLRQSSKETTGNNNANVTRSADEKKVNIWRGGGLADILDSYHNGVTFEAFEYDAAKNAHQVQIYLCIAACNLFH